MSIEEFTQRFRLLNMNQATKVLFGDTNCIDVVSDTVRECLESKITYSERKHGEDVVYRVNGCSIRMNDVNYIIEITDELRRT